MHLQLTKGVRWDFYALVLVRPPQLNPYNIYKVVRRPIIVSNYAYLYASYCWYCWSTSCSGCFMISCYFCSARWCYWRTSSSLNIFCCNFTVNILHIHHYPCHDYYIWNINSNIADGLIVHIIICHIVVLFNCNYLYVEPQFSTIVNNVFFPNNNWHPL